MGRAWTGVADAITATPRQFRQPASRYRPAVRLSSQTVMATTHSHFNRLEQEHEAAQFGMWIFLATELMLFGGLFTAYTVYRTLYPEGFAEGSRHLDLTLATINTVVLIVSSGVMALAVSRARSDHRRPARLL